MNERENILGRVREALMVSAPRPEGQGAVGEAETEGPPPADYGRFLPAVGKSVDEDLALFEKNAADLKADFCRVKDLADLGARLAKLREAEGWKRAASHHAALTDAACQALGLPVIWTDGGYNATELELCEVGLTECDVLVAHTGSVVVTSRTGGGRALSVLPPHHVVLARRDQLVGGLPEAFGLIKTKFAPDYPSMISFITGPSRTGDIERILVLGAHGPKKLTIFCLDG